jgi:hypothetical protein
MISYGPRRLPAERETAAPDDDATVTPGHGPKTCSPTRTTIPAEKRG